MNLSESRGLTFGAGIAEGGGVRFRLWAPSVASVRLRIGDQTSALTNVGAGWHEITDASAGAGTCYSFELPDGMLVPDPASRFQPHDVHGPSEVIDPAAYEWTDEAWAGRPWHEAVIYELHVGAFTEAGTFAAAAERLAYLAELGITAIEIMPVADFSGRRNWGYDGTLPYAPDSSYGRPEDLKRLIDLAHGHNIMVILDVVYNHFGPDGNYLPLYAADFFTNRHKTPWGDGVNFDGADSRNVRDFFIGNALYWLEEFHFDGLRLDAVHSIVDDSPLHIIDEIAQRVRATVTNRPVHLVLENEDNAARRLVRDDQGAPMAFTAQWNDDVHHVLHTAATGEDFGYYADYRGNTPLLGRALAEGFAFQGELMPYRGSARGESSAALPPAAFVSFIQNHDQIGNRAFGDRITADAPAEAVRAIAAVSLLLPQIPMLFMGEEWAAAQPFPFFCDFSGDLAQAVSKGRREEFARFPAFADPVTREKIPDPEAGPTFASAKLDWTALEREPHREWLAWYRHIIDVRRNAIVPIVPDLRHGADFSVLGDGAVSIRWGSENGMILELLANLSAAPVATSVTPAGMVFWCEGAVEDGVLAPWTVCWSMKQTL